MTVLLYRTGDANQVRDFTTWVRIPGDGSATHRLDPTRERPGLAAAIEAAFDAGAGTWWKIGRALSATPSAGLAHMPAAVANASDFGLMLAWSRLVRGWAAESETTLALCDDPWLFRHLQTVTGVTAGRPPALIPAMVRFWLRGYAARLAAAFRFAAAALILRKQRRKVAKGGGVLLVYGHPTSTADGTDGYFGDLMRRLPALTRMLHVDCRPARAQALAADGRTASLHGFGNPLHALALPFARWRPWPAQRRGEYGWLVRRAAAREGSTGQAAAISWQLHCQERWLRRCRPTIVAWPWENHSWERALARTARRLGVRTLGYQHSVVGRQMLNYAPASNSDGSASLPSRIFCTGAATRDQLLRWNIEPQRLAVAGALRFQHPAKPACDPSAPVFMALPFDPLVAAEMVAATRACAKNGLRFLIKDHPMTPFFFPDSDGVFRTDRPLGAQPAVSAVVYAATSVGLEAVLAGLPTLRFRPRGRIALDILPYEVKMPTAECDTLCEALARLAPPEAIEAAHVFAPIDERLWREALEAHDQPIECRTA